MSSYSTGSQGYYPVDSDDEEPTEVTSMNHSGGSTTGLPSSGRESPFYVPGEPSYNLVVDDAYSAPLVSPHPTQPALPTQPMPTPPRRGACTREPNYDASESWLNEMYQMKAYLEDKQIYITKRLKALERHKVEQLATNEMLAGEIGMIKEDLGEDTELPEHQVDNTGYLADDDDESDWIGTPRQGTA
ncbi:hypothetical protein L1987_54632 [Smallanthus sonchifolius]|uniref:Uncharacterized protein n=1 Tax=Smallanthus sonchifolius TaxID=185202 RepID=A0ACB9E8R8_9ASTR|nr:hypothetical protein L1987_54632 [Smallanthus sonchifolius]